MINIKEQIYFLVNASFDEYHIMDLNENILLKINCGNVVNYYIEDNVFYVNFHINDLKITYSNNTLFFNYKNKIILYNLNDNDFEIIERYSKIISNDKIIRDCDNKYYVYDLIKKTKQEIDIKKYFNDVDKYKINNEIYYLEYDNNIYYLEYYKYNFNLFLYIPKIEYTLDKYIMLGTIENQVNLPLDYLIKYSEYLKNMFKDMDYIPSELIHPSFENINLYYDFINCKKVNNLYGLFKLCSLLLDKNINLVGELIIEYVYENNMLLETAFKYLELLSTSICDKQLLKLFYIVINKYKSVDIMDFYNNMDKHTVLYNFITKETMKSLLNKKN